MTRDIKWRLKKIREGCCPRCGKPNPEDMVECADCRSRKKLAAIRKENAQLNHIH